MPYPSSIPFPSCHWSRGVATVERNIVAAHIVNNKTICRGLIPLDDTGGSWYAMEINDKSRDWNTVGILWIP